MASPYNFATTYQPYKKNVPGAKPLPPTGYAPGGIQYDVPPGPAPVFGAAPVAAPKPVTAPTITRAATPGRWNIPDYGALLAGDWEPNEAAIQGQNMRNTAQADFQKALRTAFIDFGGDVGKFGQYAQYIDQPTIEAAKANKFSSTAQNLAAMTKNLRQSRARNAARGMTSSGASTEATRRALEAREWADVEAGRAFTGGAETGLRGLAKVETDIAELIRQSKARAAERIARENPQTWTEGTEAEYAPAEEAGAAVPAAPARPAAPAPWGGISWGGRSGIKTKAGLIAALAPGVTYAQWARNHPDAAARLR